MRIRRRGRARTRGDRDAVEEPGAGDLPTGDPIPRLAFKPPQETVPGFEIIDLATLHRRRARRDPDGVHRVDFHTLSLITEGSGEHAIDSVTYPCRPGTLLWVRPGQVQRYVRPGATDGVQLLFTSSFPPHLDHADRVVSEWNGPGCRQLGTSADYAGRGATTDARGTVRQEGRGV
ncbi:AraC family ligand binding domain-containing protein [Streptomyces sp. NPDC005374]|uniref:AraC family ligand binding domain-containing protein n=1 Tax=Streptomyces sp. NPDC005374 TaxID=3364713 RepID=UPI00368A1916